MRAFLGTVLKGDSPLASDLPAPVALTLKAAIPTMLARVGEIPAADLDRGLEQIARLALDLRSDGAALEGDGGASDPLEPPVEVGRGQLSLDDLDEHLPGEPLEVERR